MLQQRLAIGDRILLRRRGQFVDETLDHEDVVGRADTAPERGRNARRLDAHIVDMDIRESVGRFAAPSTASGSRPS